MIKLDLDDILFLLKPNTKLFRSNLYRTLKQHNLNQPIQKKEKIMIKSKDVFKDYKISWLFNEQKQVLFIFIAIDIAYKGGAE